MNEHRTQAESTKRRPLIDQASRASSRDSNRTLRRISIVIWILVVACFVLAAVVWAALLRSAS